jgi:hypothetical protein
MKLLLRIIAGLAIVVLLLVAVAFLFPREYRIERSLAMKAKPDAVLPQIADLRAWKSWSAWHQRDPDMKLSYSAQTTGVGAWSAWDSKKEGNGKMTITGQMPTKVDYALEFLDVGMKALGTMELAPEPGGVRVVWSTTGDLGMNPVNRWFGLFLDKLIGTDFERGLANLKQIVEK